MEEAPSDINNDGLESLDTSSVHVAADEIAADAAEESPSDIDNNSIDGPDLDIEGWFNRHKLPFTDGVQISLDDWGVECVEQLKLLPSDVFLGMYDSEKFILRETAVSQKTLPVVILFCYFTYSYHSCYCSLHTLDMDILCDVNY